MCCICCFGLLDAGTIDGDQENSSANEEVYRVPREMGILHVLPCTESNCGGGTYAYALYYYKLLVPNVMYWICSIGTCPAHSKSAQEIHRKVRIIFC